MAKLVAGPLLPILFREITFSRAAVAANMRGQSLRDFADAALEAAITQAERQHRADEHARACRAAIARRDIAPTRHEFDRDQVPFVRRQRSASEFQAERPSSRQHQNGRAAEAGSKSAQPGPERPAVTRSAASMARTREDPHFDAAETPATSPKHPPPRGFSSGSR